MDRSEDGVGVLTAATGGRRSRRRKTFSRERNLLPEVDQILWKWGDWANDGSGLPTCKSQLGGLVKRRAAELGDMIPAIREIHDDNEMLIIDQIIRNLRKKERKIVCLRYEQRRSPEIVARYFHISEKNMYKLLHKAHESIADFYNI